VKSLLDGAVSTLTMVLKRPVGTYQISFDLDLKAPKKSKAGESKRIYNTMYALSELPSASASKRVFGQNHSPYRFFLMQIKLGLMWKVQHEDRF